MKRGRNDNVIRNNNTENHQATTISMDTLNSKQMEPTKDYKIIESRLSRKEFFREFLSGLTMHGFRFLFEGSTARRLLWFLITTAISLLMTLLFYQLLSDYLGRKITTNINKSRKASYMRFPTITICPFNSKSKLKLENLPGNISAENFLDFLNGLSYDENFLNNSNHMEILQTLQDHNITTYEAMMKAHLMSYEDLVTSDVLKAYMKANGKMLCSFYEKPCTVADFKTVLFQNEFCSQFNAYDPARQGKTTAKRSSDISKGFNIYLDLGESYLKQPNQDFTGLIVLINKYGESHLAINDNEIVIVKPGDYMFIKLTQRDTKLLPAPYSSQCVETKELKLVRNRTYSKTMCTIDCLLQKIYEICGCIGFDLQEYVDVEDCAVENMSCYLQNSYDLFENAFDGCYNSCPYECSRTGYTVMKSPISVGNKEVYYKLKEMLPAWKNQTVRYAYDYVRANIVGVHVSFQNHAIITEEMMEAVSWTTLLGTIGGSIGLGFGFSFVTCFEFIFFFYDYVTLSWKKK